MPQKYHNRSPECDPRPQTPASTNRALFAVEVLQHLLGTPVLVFLLLPLVLSCKSTKTKEEIIQNYQHIIQLQLENILQPIECISTVSCTRLPKDIHGHLQNELQKLVKVIGESLGCPCARHQQEVKWPDSQSLHKKYCKLKRLLTTIQNAYEQHNSA
ncbi:hypothetical protein C0J50_20341 [Silurus asotus]|uniref:Uncharacterized protein n=1 Tax=Silurus asotus TaxID=30991 RepID=A0AAD5FKK7_SILAS|nr:hypothetical protein C0J50_20341 [Silurus asotus]